MSRDVNLYEVSRFLLTCSYSFFMAWVSFSTNYFFDVSKVLPWGVDAFLVTSIVAFWWALADAIYRYVNNKLKRNVPTDSTCAAEGDYD